MAAPVVRVALAGARAIPARAAAGHVLRRLAKLPAGSTVLLRRPKSPGSRPGEFELLASRLAAILGLPVEWCRPEGSDRSQTYLRDLDMVRRSDYVVAFFHDQHTMEGGTGHVVEAAWSQAIAVEAFSVADDGTLVEVGSFDPSTDGP